MNEEFGWCDLHEDSVDEGTYQWKGCWSCYHFSEEKDFPYMFVNGASSELKVSQSTIRRWIKLGKLEGYLFEQGRHTNLPAPKKYHITIKSVQNFLNRMNKSE